MSDLYDDLGVPRDASEDEIRKAYRKRAKKDHPDAGGEPGAFERIQRAVAVLSDPDKRARYDETGDAEESDKPDMAQAEALALIQQVLTAALNQHDPDKTDIVGKMRESFENARRAAMNDVNSKRQQAARFLRLAKKATSKGKRNIVAQLLEGTARDMERAAGQGEAMAKRFTLALEMISDASWEFTPPPPSPYTGYMADPTQANMQQGQSGLWFFR